jgi:hypothetical protein
MATTYTLISSNTVSSATAAVTFSSIPSTYTDLVLVGSMRDSQTVAAISRSLSIRVNNDASAIYSYTDIEGDGAAASSTFNTSRTVFFGTFGVNGDTSTANTFNSFELYIPSYTAATNKQASLSTVVENNAATAYIVSSAELYRDTTAISRLDIRSHSGNATIMVGSSFYLYGIKNS